MSEPSTDESINRILNAAEEVFAQYGYDGASLRNITKRANVNLAAAHYHVGDKESLFTSVLIRRLRPLNEARLARLEQAEQQSDNRLVPLARILELMVEPVFGLWTDPARGGPHLGRILGRSLIEPLPFMDELLARELHPAMGRFSQAVRRHVPNLSPDEFLWRFSFVVGALHHTLATLHRMKPLTRGICRNDDHAGAYQRFIPFAVAVFMAPATNTGEPATG